MTYYSQYYNDNLSYLYDNTNNNTIYNIDNTLYNYIKSDNNFVTNINLELFLSNIANVTIFAESPNDVSIRSNINELTFINNISKYNSLDKTSTFIDNASSTELVVIIKRDNFVNIAFNQKLLDRLYNNIKNPPTSTTYESVHGYLYDIIYFTTYAYFSLALTTLINNNPGKNGSIIYNSILSFGNLYESQQLEIFSSLSNSCKICMKTIIDNLGINQNNDIMSDFNGSNPNFISPLYYELRTMMYKKLDFKKFFPSADQNTILYIQKILTDLFLKSCYPIIHLSYITTMISNNSSNFVNMRIALLAEIYFVQYFINGLKDNVYPTIKSMITGTIITNYDNLFTNMQTTISNYLTYLNNINTVAGENSIANIIIKNHTLSSKVENDYVDINAKSTDISSNQMVLRNLITNVEIIKRRNIWYKIIFWSTIVFIVIHLILSPIFIYYNKTYYLIHLSLFMIVAIILTIIYDLIMLYFIRI